MKSSAKYKGYKMNNKILILLTFILSLVFITSSCIIINQSDASDDGQTDTVSESQDEEEPDEIEDTDETGADTDDEDDEVPADDLSDFIIVDSPQPDQIITSPLLIEGQARGTWFFEASFPIRLLDAEGNIITEHYAQTEEEWMTEEFISFSSLLEFEAPAADSGTLILIKDNPSDIREYDAQLEIPVRFR
jgi:hypothetical protein